MEDFIFKKVDFKDSATMEQIYRLRFEVYCWECGFLKEEDYPDRRDSDEYDVQSVHFAALDSEGAVIATLRMILPGALPLPIQTHCHDIHLPPNDSLYGEISRLVISRRLRRRKDDHLYYGPQVTDEVVITDHAEYLRRARPMAFGLYREMYRESKARGITHWFSLMEKGLWLLLAIHGFKFSCIGEEVDVYGPVKPYRGNVSEIEVEVRKKFPKFFSYFMQTS